MNTLKKISLVALGLLLCFGCSEEKPGKLPECCADDPAAVEISHDSLYQLDSTWTDHEGKPRKLREFAGSLQVVAMIFTHCEYACPMTMAVLKKIEAKIAKKPVHFLLLSIDPERDTPKVLRAYAQKEELDLHRWTLLTADAGSVREVAAVLGIRYKQNPDGGFAHSNLITLLDRRGSIHHRLEGLGAEPEPLIAAMEK